MFSVLTPYNKIFRRAYDKALDFAGVTTGMWVKIVGGLATPIANGDDLTPSVLRPVLDRISDSAYEAHDTMDSIAVLEGYGIVCKTDKFVATSIVSGSPLAVGVTVDVNLGILKIATSGEKVVGECISVSADFLEYSTVSPSVLA